VRVAAARAAPSRRLAASGGGAAPSRRSRSARQQLAQAPIVRRAVGQVEVAQHGNLVHRATRCRLGRHGGDALRVGVRAGSLDTQAGVLEGVGMDGPGDDGEVVSDGGEVTTQHDERADVAGRADGGDRDPQPPVSSHQPYASRSPIRAGNRTRSAGRRRRWLAACRRTR
jgi:hypothetical protein